jgi:ATP-dependent helicase/nuclease subunit A
VVVLSGIGNGSEQGAGGQAGSVAWAAQTLQQNASEHNRSVWVAASAGSGKTKVLTDRVLRLLLSGARPERILCLTFTKAAAAEMATRIAGRLSAWSVVDDATLVDQLRDLSGRAPEAIEVGRARRLFATVLDAPGGLEVQTIHGFCQSVLRRFPLEAGLPPQFDVLDERTAAERMRMARDLMILGARRGATPGFGEALSEVAARVSEDGLSDLVGDLLSERSRLEAAITQAGGIDALAEKIRALLGVEEGDRDAALVASATQDHAFDGPALRTAAGALVTGTKVDIERGDIITAWMAAPWERAAGFEFYKTAFLIQKGHIRATLATKKVVEGFPGVLEALTVEAERLVALEEQRRALDLAVRTVALVQVATSVLEIYEADKRRHGLVDYDDLILATRDLLCRPGVAAWVLFKLDGGLDHVLIDEAQDTNPEQWRIVEKLTEEFFAGTGIAENQAQGDRTVFAVGDVKQSIFSFQRADPQGFLDMRELFAGRVTAAEKNWSSIDLDMSFRSTEAVLGAVDAVFNTPPAGVGVLQDRLDGTLPELRHRAHRAGQSGLVELWPPEMPVADDEERSGWEPPVTQRARDEPRRRLAEKIADRIDGWLQNNEILRSKDRPIRPGDIMVLVRRRGSFVGDLVRALKDRKIAVAGVDRMVLTDQLAVMDLVAFGQFLLLPDDDLNLATVLKGPLIGLTEDRLFELCWERSHHRLWRELTERAQDDDELARVFHMLSGWLARADFTPPYELYAELLASGGRRHILERLGLEAGDPVDEFLAQSLEYERTHVPSLQGFLHWLAAADFVVKRDLETGQSNQVRILTVHGSKGLQAPIVFLPDTMVPPDQTPKLLWTKSPGGDSGVGAVPIWSPNRDTDVTLAAEARRVAADQRDREYHRLLYVAMTRAEDRLYVAGWRAKKAPAGISWYEMIREGIEPIAHVEADCLIVDCPQTGDPDGRVAAMDRPTPVAALPSWAASPPIADAHPPRPLSPSRLEPEPPVRSPFEDGDSRRFRRGRIIHYLLQWLPTMAPELRDAAARHYLSRPIHDLPLVEQDTYIVEIHKLFYDPRLQDLFSSQALAEVPIVGMVGEGAGAVVLSGRIDRLLVRDDEILVVDFKTNRPPPHRVEDVPGAYLRQMAAYRVLLADIYPGRSVRCALLWTDGPNLMDLPEQLLSVSAGPGRLLLPELDGPPGAS